MSCEVVGTKLEKEVTVVMESNIQLFLIQCSLSLGSLSR